MKSLPLNVECASPVPAEPGPMQRQCQTTARAKSLNGKAVRDSASQARAGSVTKGHSERRTPVLIRHGPLLLARYFSCRDLLPAGVQLVAHRHPQATDFLAMKVLFSLPSSTTETSHPR